MYGNSIELTMNVRYTVVVIRTKSQGVKSAERIGQMRAKGNMREATQAINRKPRKERQKPRKRQRKRWRHIEQMVRALQK